MKLYHFGVSGGKDSTALLLWATYESGIPLEQIRVTFCNTGNESPITLAYIAMLSHFIFPIEVLSPERGFYDLAAWKQRFPGKRSRFCTQLLKMQPTQEWVKAAWKDGHEVVLHSGVRAAESKERSQLAVEDFDGYYACLVRRPLLGWTLHDVWAIHHRYDVFPNPLYEMGAKRVGCFPCIFSRKSEIRLLAERFPERIDFIRERELSTGKKGSTFFQRDKVPESQRSRTVTCEDGRILKVPTIDDVVRWSKTVRGGKQYSLGTIEQDSFEQEDDKTISCPSAIGQCE